MQDLNSIPGLQEMFEKSYPKIAKMNAANPATPLSSGGISRQGGNGLKFFWALLGMGFVAGLIYLWYREEQEKKTKVVKE
jgi:hypothetical protein